MPDTLCRLAVHATGPREPIMAELVLPATRPVGELLPSIVDLVVGESAPGAHWQLVRIGGAALDASQSLWENMIDDGDMLVLTTVQTARPRSLATESSGVVAAAAVAGRPAPSRGAVFTAGIAGTVLSAAALISAGRLSDGTWPLWSAATLAAGTAVASVAVGRSDRHVAGLTAVAAVVFASTTGVLAVPGTAWQFTLLLAAAAAFALSAVLWRVTPDSTMSTALAAFTGAVSAAAAFGVGVTARAEAVGAALILVSLGALSTAPKMTVLIAGLGPSRPRPDEHRAAAAHRVLSGLVAGCSAATALGAVVVAAVAVRTGSQVVQAAVFAADVGMILLLRQRSQLDGLRRICLCTAGFAALATAAVVMVARAPAHGFWACAAAVMACGVWLSPATRSDPAPSPLVRRTVQVVEYAALMAVIPLASWLTGLYEAVREMSVA